MPDAAPSLTGPAVVGDAARMSPIHPRRRSCPAPRSPRHAALACLVLVVASSAGCARARTTSPAVAPAVPAAVPAPAPAAAAPRMVLRHGQSGREVPWSTVESLVQRSDVIFFGEYHDDRAGAEFERRLWEQLSTQRGRGARPATLAMEFIERDTQPVLDAYLAGTLPEAEFVKQARQGPGYAAAHRPLVEHAKAVGRPVIAANAPRPLVTAYRKQAAPYAEWLATLTDAQRGSLPRSTSTPDDAYKARFLGLMGGERGNAIFKAQALWDDAMAEAVADRRAAHPAERVLLVVGAFHVQGRLGTITKFRERRPGDRIAVIAMAYGEDEALRLPEDMRGEADLVLVVPKPPSRPAPAKHPPAVPKAPAAPAQAAPQP